MYTWVRNVCGRDERVGPLIIDLSRRGKEMQGYVSLRDARLLTVLHGVGAACTARLRAKRGAETSQTLFAV